MSYMDLKNRAVLVTGTAGSTGSNLIKRLCKNARDVMVAGIDSMNDYYSVRLEGARPSELLAHPSFIFVQGSIADRELVNKIFEQCRPQIAIDLATQAGVRYPITDPDACVESDLTSFYNVLEACRHSFDDGRMSVEHLVYISSSSIYGSNKKVSYNTDDRVDNPVSLYAATKKSDELAAHTHAELYNISSTGFGFFTIYGPANRPNMAYFGFTGKSRVRKTIQIFSYDSCKRDFTYVDGTVTSTEKVMTKAPDRAIGEDRVPVPPYALYDIRNNHPRDPLNFVQMPSKELARAGILSEDYDSDIYRELLPTQPGDTPVTHAGTSVLERDFRFKPSVDLGSGLRRSAERYKKFYIQERYLDGRDTRTGRKTRL